MSRTCLLPHGNWSQCLGYARFHDYYSHLEIDLARSNNSISAKQLLLPRHSRLLFFGFSYLRQVTDELWCADATLDWSFAGQDWDASLPRHVLWHEHFRVKMLEQLTRVIRWRSRQQNASALIVTNVERLQHSNAVVMSAEFESMLVMFPCFRLTGFQYHW